MKNNEKIKERCFIILLKQYDFIYYAQNCLRGSFSFMLTLNIDILCFTLDNIFIHIESLDLHLHGSYS